MPKMSGFVKTFKVKDVDKYKNNKSTSFRTDDEKLLENYKAIWTKMKDLRNIELNAFRVCDDKYMKTKLRTYHDKVYTNFPGLNVLKDDIACDFFRGISIGSLIVFENKYYLQVYLDICAYDIANKKMTDYLDENLSEDWVL